MPKDTTDSGFLIPESGDGATIDFQDLSNKAEYNYYAIVIMFQRPINTKKKTY